MGVRVPTETCSWDRSTSADLSYYAAVVYGPCMMSVLLCQAGPDKQRQTNTDRQRETEGEAKKRKRNHRKNKTHRAENTDSSWKNTMPRLN